MLSNPRSELQPGELNILDAPEGCYAAKANGSRCDGCTFYINKDCTLPAEYSRKETKICNTGVRNDGYVVIFKRLE